MGLFMLLMGIFKLNFIENVYSQPTMTGYLLAASTIIFIEQLAGITGIHLKSTSFFMQLYEFFSGLSHANTSNCLVAFLVFTVFFMDYIVKTYWIKNSLILTLTPIVYIVIASMIVSFPALDKKYGITMTQSLSSEFPAPIWPYITWENFTGQLVSSVKISLVAFTEGLLITKKFARKNGFNKLLIIIIYNLLNYFFIYKLLINNYLLINCLLIYYLLINLFNLSFKLFI